MEPRPDDVALPVLRLDFAAMKRHEFDSRTSVPGNLFYKIQFLTGIEEVRYV